MVVCIVMKHTGIFYSFKALMIKVNECFKFFFFFFRNLYWFCCVQLSNTSPLLAYNFFTVFLQRNIFFKLLFLSYFSVFLFHLVLSLLLSQPEKYFANQLRIRSRRVTTERVPRNVRKSWFTQKGCPCHLNLPLGTNRLHADREYKKKKTLANAKI